MEKYTEILNIQLRHQYYSNEDCKEETIQASQKTQDWLKQVQGFFKPKGTVWALLLPARVDLEVESRENPGFSLEFECHSLRSNFFEFTDAPLNELGQFVFSDEGGVDLEQSPIELKRTFESEPSPGGKVAIIKITLENLAGAKEKWPLNYQARFQARSVQWKYFILTGKGQTYEQLILKGEGSNLFEEKEDETIPGGQVAKIMSSGENKIALQESSTIDMSLSCMKSTGEELLIDHLPNANGSGLQYSDSEKLLYAAIYVYL